VDNFQYLERFGCDGEVLPTRTRKTNGTGPLNPFVITIQEALTLTPKSSNGEP